MDVKINIAGEEKVVRLLNETGRRTKDLAPPFADLGERLVRKIGRRIGSIFKKKTSGRLKGSLTYKQGPDSLVVSAGGRSGMGGDLVRYAGIQHRGGVIKAKSKKFLTIPFPGGPADKARVQLRARDFKDTFIAKGIIFQKGKDKPVPLFILRKAVKIPAKPYMNMDESDILYLRRSVAEYVTGEWK